MLSGQPFSLNLAKVTSMLATQVAPPCIEELRPTYRGKTGRRRRSLGLRKLTVSDGDHAGG